LLGRQVAHCHETHGVDADLELLGLGERANLVVHDSANRGDAVAAFHDVELAILGAADDWRDVVPLQDTIEEVELHLVAPHVRAIAAVDFNELGGVETGGVHATGKVVVELDDGGTGGAGLDGHCLAGSGFGSGLGF